MAAVNDVLGRLPRPRRARLPALPSSLADLLERVRGVPAPLTAFGWTLAGIGLLGWWAGARLGWQELLLIAAGCLLAVGAGLVATLRRPHLQADVVLPRDRVVVGETAVARVETRNTRSRRVAGARLEVPVGLARATFDAPALAVGETWDDAFVIPTDRRQVVAVGPAALVAGDPLGVARREQVTSEARTLYVHPRTVALPGISSGWLRDLEGRTTQDLSTSDVAFHTLREYVPGDDPRHVHWRTTAKLGGKLVVRQFVDTRRSHLGLVLPLSADEWQDDDEFELAVSAAASLGRAVLGDGQEVSAIAGRARLPAANATQLLDGLAGVELADGERSLEELVHTSIRPLHNASIALLVVGAAVDHLRARRLAAMFPMGTTCVVLRCDRSADVRRHRSGRVTVLDVAELVDLQRILAVGGVR